MRETRVRSLGWEDPLEKEMASHSSILAWRIPWTEESGGLQSTGSQRVGYDWATSLHFTSIEAEVPWYCSSFYLARHLPVTLLSTPALQKVSHQLFQPRSGSHPTFTPSKHRPCTCRLHETVLGLWERFHLCSRLKKKKNPLQVFWPMLVWKPLSVSHPHLISKSSLYFLSDHILPSSPFDPKPCYCLLLPRLLL